MKRAIPAVIAAIAVLFGAVGSAGATPSATVFSRTNGPCTVDMEYFTQSGTGYPRAGIQNQTTGPYVGACWIRNRWVQLKGRGNR